MIYCELFFISMRYAVFITGPAGAGKSTLTAALHEHYKIMRTRTFCFNLDPACEFLPYEPDFDIREVVTGMEV